MKCFSKIFAIVLCFTFSSILALGAGVTLEWDPATDNVGVLGYRVLRSTTDGGPYAQIGQTSNTFYSDTTVENSRTYYYAVEAYDAAQNTSPQSNHIAATVPAPSGDTTPPEVSITFPVGGTSVSGVTEIRTTAFDAVDVVRVDVFVDGGRVGTATRNAADPSLWVISWNTSAVGDGVHTLTATALDSSGNERTSPPIPITVQNGRGTLALGDRVRTTDNLNVRENPGISGALLGTQSTGSLGRVMDGPVPRDNFEWWSIDYDTGPDGWSAGQYLARTTTGGGGGALPCDTLSLQLDALIQRIRDAETRTAAAQESLAARLETTWRNYHGRQIAGIDNFEASVNRLMATLEARATTARKQTAIANFRGEAEALLAARRAALTNAYDTFLGGAVEIIGERKDDILLALQNRIADLTTARDEAVALCRAGTSLRDAKTIFFGKYGEVLREYGLAVKDANAVYSTGHRALTAVRISAIVAATSDYRSGYAAAWSAFRSAYYTR